MAGDLGGTVCLPGGLEGFKFLLFQVFQNDHFETFCSIITGKKVTFPSQYCTGNV